MVDTRIEEPIVALDGNSTTVAVSPWAFASVQVIPGNYGSTTGTIEIKKSLTGNPADAVSFASAVSPNMTSKAIIDSIDIRDIAFLHITTTADGTKFATVYIHLSEA